MDLAKRTEPDLALVDINLFDGPTGVSLAEKLAATCRVQVVFMSANVARIPENYAGAVGHIGKPYTEHGVKAAMAYLQEGLRTPPPSMARPPSLVLSPGFVSLWAQ